jgi:hypothetical protein
MKRLVLVAAAAALLAFPAAHANAASSATPTLAQFKALQTQVKALQAQVKTLQKWVPKSCTAKTCFTLRSLSATAAFTYEAEICQNAAIADVFQSTWTVVDQIAAATQGGKTYFGAQTAIADKDGCSNIGFTRSHTVPPSAAVFNSLVTLLTS